MESIYVEINGEKELKVERNLLFTSKVGEQSFISWQQVDDDKVNYVIAAYEFTRKGQLQVVEFSSRGDPEHFGAWHEINCIFRNGFRSCTIHF